MRRCAFCGKSQQHVSKLIAGTGGLCICDGCVGLCTELIEDERAEPSEDGMADLPTPREIHAYLEQYVVGQQSAKQALSVAVYNHYKRIRAAAADSGPRPGDAQPVEFGKSNVLLIGPTGCGKTHLVQTLARMLDVPFAMADATALTQSGYVGEDVESILLTLLTAADHDVRKAETGIVYIDEIDKIARTGAGPAAVRDVSGEGVQQALLKILEGTVASVPASGGRGHTPRENIQIDTSNVLFIVGGAFDGLERISEQRTGRRHTGFATVPHIVERPRPRASAARVSAADLRTFGLIPELVGRLPVVAAFEPLDETALVQILTEPRNALIKQYQKLFHVDGVELEFSDDAVAAIAEQALLRRTGARALRAILEAVLLNVAFEVPSRDDVARVVVHRDTVLGSVEATLIPHEREEGVQRLYDTGT
jgi:ATP-dependent Clp protease ATP-binding subunit ClpX